MKDIQEEIMQKTKELVSNFSILKVIIYIVVSTGSILLILYTLQYGIDWIVVLSVLGVSIAYTLIKELVTKSKSKKMLLNYYEYFTKRRKNVELYIPIFSRTKQGFHLKKAALYFENNQLYMEAFKQQRMRNQPEDSVKIRAGRDFVIAKQQLEFKDKIVTYNAKLMDTDYDFSMIYIKEIYDRIESSKGV